MKTVLFVNFSSQMFSGIPYPDPKNEGDMIVDENCKWNNVPDSFKPGESRYMEDWRAVHFARHLINRELTRIGKPIDDAKLQKEMLEKCIIQKGEDIPSQNIEMELMNLKNAPSSELKNDAEYQEFLAYKANKDKQQVKQEIKKGRPKKEVPQEEFADLKA